MYYKERLIFNLIIFSVTKYVMQNNSVLKKENKCRTGSRCVYFFEMLFPNKNPLLISSQNFGHKIRK